MNSQNPNLTSKVEPISSPIEVLAYYFPQWHVDPRNDVTHHPGWTEWELLRAAKPRFPGHRQPITPAWGEFDESDPTWAAREIDLAADHGITGFLFDWYWDAQGPFLQHALERGFLRAANRSRLKFALMWANHWPATATDFEELTNHAIEHCFNEPNYFMVDGAPYFSIYEMDSLIEGLGGLEAARAALESFRRRAQAAGFPDVHLNAVAWGLVAHNGGFDDPNHVIETLGISSIDSYVWAHHCNIEHCAFPQESYERVATRNFEVWDELSRRLSVPFHPQVTKGWDPSPRTDQNVPYLRGEYPWTTTFEGNTPAAFEVALRRAKGFLQPLPEAHKIVTIYAWNEWSEGGYLLPDTVEGTAHLEAIRNVFGGANTASKSEV